MSILIRASDNTQHIIIKDSEQCYLIEKTDKLEEGSSSAVVDVARLPSHLTNKLIIVDSINSGTGRENKDIYSQVLKPILALLSIDHDYVRTTSATSIIEFSSDLSSAEDVTVVFISGDTSINEFINHLSHSAVARKINIFNVPCGTGNALVRSIGINDPVSSVVQLLTTEKVHPLTSYNVVFPSGSHYVSDSKPIDSLKFIVVFSWGFHAALVGDSDTPELRKFGLQRFQMAAEANLKIPQDYQGEMTISDSEVTTITGPFSYWLLTSVQRFEPTFVISPKGSLYDSDLYFVGHKTTTNEDLLQMMYQAYDNGSHIDNENVIYKKISPGSKIHLKFDEPQEKRRRFCIDGTIIMINGTEVDIEQYGNVINGWELFIVG